MASYIITVVYPHLELEADHAMITHTHLGTRPATSSGQSMIGYSDIAMAGMQTSVA